MDLSVLVDDVAPGADAVPGAPAWVVARVVGDLDIATAPRLRERLVGVITDGRSHIVLDLSDLGFLDSTGLDLTMPLADTVADALAGEAAG